MSTLRNYIQVSEAATASEAQIDLAEQIIDHYVGVQKRHVGHVHEGEITSLLAGQKIVDEDSRSRLSQYDNGYFKYCVIEFLSGEHAGESRPITANTESESSIVYGGDELANLAVGDIFKIYQLGKFPRQKDVLHRDTVYHKSIPRVVKDAVIAQAEFIVEMGDDYFSGNETDAAGESIGNYSYQNAGGGNQSATVKMVAPKARTMLRGIINRLGRIEV